MNTPQELQSLWGILLQVVIVRYRMIFEIMLRSAHFQVNSQGGIANNRHRSFHHQ